MFAISPLQEKQVFVKDAQDSIFAANKVLLTARSQCFSQNIILLEVTPEDLTGG